jgi:hypothetical protein
MLSHKGGIVGHPVPKSAAAQAKLSQQMMMLSAPV